MKKLSKLSFDLILNILATMIPIVLLQLVIYPCIATQIGQNVFGYMITVFSIITLVSSSMGNVLNNIRLLNNNLYNEEFASGDFNKILLGLSAINICVLSISLVFYNEQLTIIGFILITLTGALTLINAYLEVEFRMYLNYKKILFNKVFLGIGYLIGWKLFSITKSWEIIFFMGQFLSTVFLIKYTNLLREPFRTTKLLSMTVKDFVFLLTASLVMNMMNYADRLILYPLMGGKTVAIYYAATIIGKIIAIAITPINSVILSYLARISKLTRNMFRKAVLLGVGVAIVGYALCLLISRDVIAFLYPQWEDVAMHYVPLTTATAMISLLCGFFSPFSLKICSRVWQIAVNGIGCIVYFATALGLLEIYGLTGFCIGTIAGYSVRLLLMVIICIIQGSYKLGEN